MIEVMQAHWSSVLVIMFTLLVAPFYWFLVLPVQKAIKMAWITAVLATIMLTINPIPKINQAARAAQNCS
jgi:hypothetical protein